MLAVGVYASWFLGLGIKPMKPSQPDKPFLIRSISLVFGSFFLLDLPNPKIRSSASVVK